jgi:hypothetical protein
MSNENFQESFDSKKQAIERAKEVSSQQTNKVFNVVLSKGKYYVEDGHAFIRNFETLIGEYLFGKKLK